jgi:hypothetical protein
MMVGGQATPQPIYPPSRPRNTASIHCTGDWVVPRDGLDGEAENSPLSKFDPRSILAHSNKILE